MIGDMQARLSRAVGRSFVCATARRFIRQQDGATAVEFAMVAAPFLAMVFAIVETALVFFAGQALETAGADSARLIMTGQAQTQGYDQAQFKQAVCARIYGLFRLHERPLCRREELHDIQFHQYDEAGRQQRQLANQQLWLPAGGPGSIVVVRLMYQWPVYVSLLGLNLADSAGSTRLLMSTVAFRNEPYGG